MASHMIGNMKATPFESLLDEEFGKVGTPDRDRFEAEVDEAVQAYHIGKAIKAARLKQNLTQEELGERVGVKKARISRIERGHSITLPTMSRVFKALGIPTASVDLGIYGKLALW